MTDDDRTLITPADLAILLDGWDEDDRLRAALDAGEDRASVVDRFSVSPTTVRDIAHGRVTGRPEAPSAMAARWQAACMDPDEWEAWQDTNRRLTSHGDQATRPCDDCTLGFAADMRALGRCNGTPAGADEEDEPMDTVPARPEPEPPTRRPTPKQTRRWNLYHRLGSQTAAARAEGVDQGTLRKAILQYMRIRGIPEPIPAPDPALAEDAPTVSTPTPARVEQWSQLTSAAAAPAPLQPWELPPVITAVPDDVLPEPSGVWADRPPADADFLARLQAAIERLEAEDAAQRREMARRIERLRDAGEVYRRLMEDEAA